MRPALGAAAMAIALGACAPPAAISEDARGRAAAVAPADTLALVPFGPTFGDARAVAADPRGQLYVSDGATDAVHILAPDGARLEILGGPGSGDHAFLGPRGVDPTNGRVLYVADSGNGRIQRFSHEGRLLESMAVPADPEPLVGRRVLDAPRGHPVAVAAAPAGEVYVAEAQRGVVILWDDRRSLARVIGVAGDGRGELRRPVDVALDPEGRLLVADAGHHAILVYDAFGEFIRRLADGLAVDVRAVAADHQRIVAILPDRILFYSLDGRFDRAAAPGTSEPLVGGTLANGELVLLTRTRVWRNRRSRRKPQRLMICRNRRSRREPPGAPRSAASSTGTTSPNAGDIDWRGLRD